MGAAYHGRADNRGVLIEGVDEGAIILGGGGEEGVRGDGSHVTLPLILVIRPWYLIIIL